MGFCEILTIIFILLKVFGFVEWSWLIVLLPEIIAVVFYIVWFGFVGSFINKTHKSIRKSHDDFFKNF